MQDKIVIHTRSAGTDQKQKLLGRMWVLKAVKSDSQFLRVDSPPLVDNAITEDASSSSVRRSLVAS